MMVTWILADLGYFVVLCKVPRVYNTVEDKSK